jgi:hypothetical protein
MTTLATLRADLRKDLHDEDAAAYRWTDSVLDRHIKRALREYSQVSPLEDKALALTSAGSRDISLASVTSLIRVVAVEYPTGEYPPNYTPFSVFENVLTMDLETPPSGIEDVNLFLHLFHTINGTQSFPDAHDDIILAGAAGYAALEWASFASNRVNTGGPDVWGRYMDFANVRLAQFREMLAGLPARSRVKTSRMYSPFDQRLTSETTDPGPV